MARKRQEGMTDRETEIMRVIWSLGEATVEAVREKLEGDLADSTVRTLLGIMQAKGYVKSHLKGRANVFHALIQQKEAQASALRTLTNRLFQGSPDRLVARLVEDEQISLEELDRLRKSLRRRQKES